MEGIIALLPYGRDVIDREAFMRTFRTQLTARVIEGAVHTAPFGCRQDEGALFGGHIIPRRPTEACSPPLLGDLHLIGMRLGPFDTLNLSIQPTVWMEIPGRHLPWSLRFRFLSAARVVCVRTLLRAMPCGPPAGALRTFRPYEVQQCVQHFTAHTSCANALCCVVEEPPMRYIHAALDTSYSADREYTN